MRRASVRLWGLLAALLFALALVACLFLWNAPGGEWVAVERDGEELFRFRPDDGKTLTMIQQVRFADGIWTVSWRPTRPIPSDDDFFENVWRQYQDNRNIY